MKSAFPACAGSALLAILGCHAGPPAPPSTAPAPTQTVKPASSARAPGLAAPGPAAKPAPAPPPVSPQTAGSEGQAFVVHDGQESWVNAAAAARSGYTIVDFSDDWTPFIFAEQKGPDGATLKNRYRRVFVGLANDTLDEDGEPLPAGEKNYLELYGIPPCFGILRARFLADETQTCHASISLEKLEEVETIAYVAPEKMKAEAQRLARLRRDLEDARRKNHAADFAELAQKDPSLAAKVKAYEKRIAEKEAMTEAEKRLACEGMFKKGLRHTTGVYDDAMRLAVRRFQQKNMIYESNYLRSKTMDALARPPLANDYLAFMRVLRERVVDATGVVEDGSAGGKAGPPTYTNKAGKAVPLRNLVDELTQATAEQLGLTSQEAVLAFFKRHPAADLRHLRAAVRLPRLPEYYGPDMDLSIVIDRGDVWYELPWDDKGVRHPQPRKRYPSFHLYLKYNNQRILLARWRTTVGGWRAEQASDGYEYFRYKGSDVGSRVVRNVVAGPVWIAPESTPIRALLKMKTVGSAWQRVVNYDELGPGYLSAYGLVAGYFVQPGRNGRPDWDNGIRAHGSSDYLSIYSSEGYSHGCHRLPNHLAIRLYDFILRHRPMRALGDQGMGFARQFLAGDNVYEIRLPSRGFLYQLDPPLPVEVLEGDIKGSVKTPVSTYVPKPGVKYPGPPPPVHDTGDSRAGDDAKPEAEP
jgi:lipoprotein-anchoring transpeptidase ErfK/SrfK